MDLRKIESDYLIDAMIATIGLTKAFDIIQYAHKLRDDIYAAYEQETSQKKIDVV